MTPPRVRPITVAHSQRFLEVNQRFPPRGWGKAGLANHLAEVARACCLLIAYADPDYREERIRHARATELRHLRDHLADAVEEVLDAIGEAETRPLDMRAERQQLDRDDQTA